MTRLYYLDILRGVAVLLMVPFQLAEALKLINLYGDPSLNFLSRLWTFLFWFCAGFSVVLMCQKYSFRKFWLKLLVRFAEFSAIGFFLMLYVPFNIPNPWLYEAVASIGFNALILGLIVCFKRIEVYVTCLGFLLVLKQVIILNLWFDPLLVLSFMLLGSILALNPPKIQIRFRILEFLGRHALLFYVAHFIIIGFAKRFFGF